MLLHFRSKGQITHTHKIGHSRVPSEKWKFFPGLSVFVGENGLDESHVLKSLYSILKTQSPGNLAVNGVQSEKLGKNQPETQIADELTGNMRPDSLGRLVKRQQGRVKAEITVSFKDKNLDVGFSFATNSKTQVDVTTMPTSHLKKPPVFIPTRELITLCPWFVSLYDSYNVPFEKAWRDTVLLLGAPSLREPREAKLRDMLLPIEEAMGGLRAKPASSSRSLMPRSGGQEFAPWPARATRRSGSVGRWPGPIPPPYGSCGR
jgi:hypothetical protein